MKVLLVNTDDGKGGAARAAYRLHQGFQSIGTDSKILVQYKTSNDPNILGPESFFERQFSKALPRINYLPIKYYHNFVGTQWSPQLFPNKITKRINKITPEVVHFHWICEGFIPITEVKKIKKTIFWTLHDMWAFTGGCHYNETCEKYQQQCGSCPQLGSSKENDLSHMVWKKKQKCWSDLNFTVITPSKWLAKCAKKSSLFQDKTIKVIPNGLNIEEYKPAEKKMARKELGLPADKKLVLFGAINSTVDKRKGFQYLKPALKQLSKDLNLELVVFGNSKSNTKKEFEIPVHYTGHVPDKKLALLYSAVDVFVAPSVQDNLPNTVMEALACGTPTVAFNIGGMPDMIEFQKNGYLAKPFEPEDFAKGIEWIVENEERHRKLCLNARAKVEKEFDLKNIVEKYSELYDSK